MHVCYVLEVTIHVGYFLIYFTYLFALHAYFKLIQYMKIMSILYYFTLCYIGVIDFFSIFNILFHLYDQS